MRAEGKIMIGICGYILLDSVEESRWKKKKKNLIHAVYNFSTKGNNINAVIKLKYDAFN